MFRIAFDPDRPLVATSSFQAGGETIATGVVFDWRARGLQAVDALAMFRSGLLAHTAPKVVVVSAKPRVRVNVQTPTQERKRRDRR